MRLCFDRSMLCPVKPFTDIGQGMLLRNNLTRWSEVRMAPITNLFNVTANAPKTTILRRFSVLVIEMKCKTFRSITLNDGTLRSFLKTTRLWGGIVQEP